MATKYAKARDTAFLWRSEYRKTKKENRCLRDVYRAAQKLLEELDGVKTEPLELAHALRVNNRVAALKMAMIKTVFAVDGE